MTNITYITGAAVLLIILPNVMSIAFLWFEEMPKEEDPCTLTLHSLDPTRYTDTHPNPACAAGGLLWYGTWGRVHLHFSLDNRTDTNFRVCLTGGLANGIFVWYNYRDKYWEPLSFPTYMAEADNSDTCRDSHRGILDLFVESPWNKYNYASFLRWEMTRHPDGWKDEEHAEDEDVITTFDKLETKPEPEVDEEMAEILESIKGKEGMDEILESLKGKEGMKEILENIKEK